MALPLPPDKDFTADAVPPEARRWYETALLRPLNEFRRLVRALLNKGLSLGTNFNAQLIGPLPLVTTAAGALAEWPLEVKSTLSGRCIGIHVLRAVELDSALLPTANTLGTWGLPTWQEKDGKLRLLAQSGPAASKRYSVTWIAWGGGA